METKRQKELKKMDLQGLMMLKKFVQNQKDYNISQNKEKSVLFFHCYLQDIIHELEKRRV